MNPDFDLSLSEVTGSPFLQKTSGFYVFKEVSCPNEVKRHHFRIIGDLGKNREY